MSTAKVSAIVPVYNVECYLKQCIESLLSQSVPFEEIILVDDGSTDGSGVICDHYAELYDCIKTFHKKNAGLGYARNTGLDNLGLNIEYVMFVDSDDWLDEGALKWLLTSIEGTNADCVMGGHTKKNSDDITMFELKLEEAQYVDEEIRDFLIPRLCGSAPDKSDSVPMSACSTLFKVSCIIDNNLRFPSEREMISEDFVFKFNFFLQASHVVISDFLAYNYRTNPGSLSMSYRSDRFEASMGFYSGVLKMIRESNLSKDCETRLSKTILIYLRMCISQEAKQISEKDARTSIGTIRKICNDYRLTKLLEDFPVSRLGKKQKVFVYLVKARAASVLYVCAELGLL
jgi:glycosyltransferase involved in cell wall biosynthesis